MQLTIIGLTLYVQLYLVPLSSYLSLNNSVTLKYKSEVTQGHWKWHNSIDRIRVPIHLPLPL